MRGEQLTDERVKKVANCVFAPLVLGEVSSEMLLRRVGLMEGCGMIAV